jgi:hypothetical protein
MLAVGVAKHPAEGAAIGRAENLRFEGSAPIWYLSPPKKEINNSLGFNVARAAQLLLYERGVSSGAPRGQADVIGSHHEGEEDARCGQAEPEPQPVIRTTAIREPWLGR